MKTRIFAAFFAAAAVFVAPARGADAEALSQQKACAACHQIDVKVVGPSFKEIAAKYRGDDGAPANLAAKIKSGGSGVWGNIPMPPNSHVSDDEIAVLVAWILSL